MDPRSPPHPAGRVGLWMVGVGLLAPALAIQSDAGAVALLVSSAFGGHLVWLGIGQYREAKVVPLVNTALALDAEGLHDEAEALRVRVDKFAAPRLRMVVRLQRAIVSLERGDLEVAREQATHAVETKARFSWLASEGDVARRNYAFGLRALACAALGDEDGGRRDAMHVQESDVAAPEALALVEAAGAVALMRRGEDAALREHLKRHRSLIREYGSGHLRGVVDALEAGLVARQTSAYRAPAADDEQTGREPLPLAATLGPGAMQRRRSERPVVAPRSTPKEPGREASPRASLQATNLHPARWQPLLVWVFLLVAFASAWHSYERTKRVRFEQRQARVVVPRDERRDDERVAEGGAPLARPAAMDGRGVRRNPPSAWPEAAAGAGLVLLFVSIFGLGIRRQRRMDRSLARARWLLAQGNDDAAKGELAPLLASRAPLTVAKAHLQLAEMAMRRADFGDALEHTDAGLARVEASSAAHDLLTPNLVSTRALALAALGRRKESEGELDVLAVRHPSYPLRQANGLAARLVGAVVARDSVAALTVAEQRTASMTVGWYVEVLADAVETASFAQSTQATRLMALLVEDTSLRRWLEAVWPDVETRLEEASLSAK